MEASKTSLRDLLSAEMRLDPRQWGPAPTRNAGIAGKIDDSGSPAVLEVDSLVHEEWLRGASTTGILPPPVTPPLPAEEMHWLLQTSCDCPAPDNWLRVSILCLLKTSDTTNLTTKRFLIPQERCYSKESIHELLTQISQENLLGSWQEVLQKVHPPSPSTGPQQLTNSYIREVVHKLYHTEIQMIQRQGRPSPLTRRHSTPCNRPSSAPPLHPLHQEDNQQPLPTPTPTKKADTLDDENKKTKMKKKKQTHSNLSPLLAALEGQRAFYLVFPYSRFTLIDIALHSPSMFNDSVSKPLFVLYQLLRTLEHCHGVGVTLGPLSLRNVFVDSRLWVQVRPPGDSLCLVRKETGSRDAEDGVKDLMVAASGENTKGRAGERKKTRQMRERRVLAVQDTTPSASPSTVTISDPECEVELSESAKDTSSESSSPVKQPSNTSSPTNSLSSEIQTVPDPPAIPLSEAVKLWQHGSLDNLTYLLLLNQHAGRRVGDANNHPIFPWVTDFTHPTRGFRDLTKSKFRLNKGDDQLNFTYQTAREEARRGAESDSSPTPHHVGDILTDVTYYVYKARQTPREVLCTHVRPRWVPEEYPSSMEKMYMWTPDECIPEYFTDPQIFRSIHSDLPDLVLPTWSDSPEHFITAHRRLLEGDYVSLQLHHWIDLTFGYKLSGEAAVRSKNVYISLVDKHKNPKNHGIVQLFRSSHPKRVLEGCSSTALLEWESYLGQSRVSRGASFPIDRQEMIARMMRGSVSLGGSHGNSAPNHKMRTLESIVEQQTQKLPVQIDREEVAVGKEKEEEVDGGVNVVEEHSNFDSSFEQITFPNDSLPSSAPSSFPNITYGDSPFDATLPSIPTTTALGKPPAVKSKESGSVGAVLNSNQTNLAVGQNRFRVARYFRQRKQIQSEGSGEEYSWQGVEIALPRDSNAVRGLVEHEERAHFVLKSCKDFSDSLGPSWETKDLEEMATTSNPPLLPPLLVLLNWMASDPHYSPSQEERVMIDVASAMATVVEFCCVRELRVATRVHASLKERVEIIRRTVSAGQLKLPSYLRNLVEQILIPDARKLSPFSPSNSHLSISASLLLQPFLPIVSFPGYFDVLHRFASSLELSTRFAGFYHNRNESDPNSLSPLEPLSCCELDAEIVSQILDSVSENLNSLVSSTANGEGFVLLLLHLYPLFQYPETSFEMVQNHLELLGRYMSHAQMSRLFSGILVNFYDSSRLLPHQHGFLLSRATADLTIRHFGLANFLAKFLIFYLEAVLEPDRLSTGESSNVRRNLFRLKETESVLTLLPTVNEVGGGVGRGGGGGGGGAEGSLHYDDQKRQSHISTDFTFSVDLSETGMGTTGYQSEGESSSEGDSAGETLPEAAASLLARGGIDVRGSIGTSMYNINEEEEEEEERRGMDKTDAGVSREKEGREGSLRTMLLPQFGYGDPDSPGKSHRLDRSMSLRDTETSRGPDSSRTTTQQAQTSSVRLLNTSLDVGRSGEKMAAVNNGQPAALEDSLPTLSTSSHSDPLSPHPAGLLPVADGQEHLRVGRKNGEKEEGGIVGGGRMVGEIERSWGVGGWEEEDGEDEEEEETGNGGNKKEEGAGVEGGKTKAEENASNDPETTAINLRIAEIAGDSLCWLICRLGPLLATTHIINPLLTGIHRCFTGVLGHRTKHKAALKCLDYMAELYGERVLIKLYLPRVDGWVASATNRMSVKTESNLAASLSLVKLITGKLSDQRLEETTPTLCEGFFIPLIQLLSSQTIFPSGSQARATICHSLVLLLLWTGRRLGREKCPNLLLETLRLFFTCFDGVYGARMEEEETAGFVTSSGRFSSQTSAPEKLSSGRGRSMTSVVGGSGNRSQDGRLSKTKKKAVSLEEDHPMKGTISGFKKLQPLKNSPSTHDLALQQLQETFTPAMAHATYIPFCKLLGQIKVNTELQNTELIEHIAYSYDDRTREENQQLPSVFLDDPSSGSSDSESEDLSPDDPSRGADDELARDVTIKMGPIGAFQQRRGLGGDDVKFSRTTWFVDLNHDRVVGGEMGGASGVPGSGGTGAGGGGGEGPVSERGSEGMVATVTGVTSGGGATTGVGVAGGMGLTSEGAMSRSMAVPPGGGGGEEGGGGKGWMDGVRGSAFATASGILGLIQNRPVPEGKGPKMDELTRHSINFDLKFQSSSHGQNSTDGCEEVDSNLMGQWSELWESRLYQSPHRVDNYSNFMAKKLQIYTGHKSTVRSLAVSDSEHFFLSASKDRTVKLWLLRNQGGGSAQIPAHLTYSQHQKPVSQVEIVSTTGDVLSCDGTVHLWDTEYGHLIHPYSSPRGREFVAMTTLLPPQQVAIVATNDAVLRFIDFRTHTLQHSWKIHLSTGGILRSLVCGDNWVAVGSMGGVVSTLELRMGGLLHQWRPSDYNLVPSTTWNENLFQLLATRHSNLVTSVGSGILHLWRPSTGKLLSHIRGQSSTTPCLDVMGEQLISVSSSGQLVIHNCFERTKDQSSALLWSSKVRSKELKGGVCSMATLQEKRLVLLGSENGQVVLMS